MDDLRPEAAGRPFEVTTPENIRAIEDYFKANPKASLRTAAQILGIKKDSINNMLRNFLKFHPYKISIHQALTPEHKAKRVDFCNKLYGKLDDGSINVENIIFSDEAHFHLDGFVNKQNCRFWASENPYYSLSKKAHPVRLTAWAAITRNKIYVTTFTENVTGEFYVQIIQRRFYPWCSKNQITKDSWFMQDGAAPHRTRDVFSALERGFGEKVIGLGYPRFHGGGLEWPPYSPDLNPCDFFLWGYIKSQVYENNPTTTDQLAKNIANKVKAIDPEMIGRVYTGFLRRLEACFHSGGDHFENIYI